ncbi:MAG: ATP synthase A1 subunit C [Actinobacteria bacterium]|nr:MAG: ATP synthase A1 subunit C [Actinomycetota bacterium]
MVQVAVQDYGYGNARIRAMRQRLLDNNFYESLVELDDFDRMVQTLQQTPYKDAVQESVLRRSGAAAIDEALKINLTRTFRRVLSFLSPQGQTLLQTLLGRWDIHNIKTILRGIHMSISTEEITDSLLPAGQLEEIELGELAKQQDVKGCIDLLATWGISYARPLTKEVPAYMETEDLSVLELALDKYYFAYSLRRIREMGANGALVKDILQTQIDIVNMLTLLRLQKSKQPEEEVMRLYIPWGKEIRLERFLELAQKEDVDDMVDGLLDTSYGKILEGAMMKYVEVGSLAALERALENYFVQKGAGMSKGDPLGVGIVIGYIWAKHNEIVNLRIIVKGRTVGMPEKRIREELIFV